MAGFGKSKVDNLVFWYMKPRGLEKPEFKGRICIHTVQKPRGLVIFLGVQFLYSNNKISCGGEVEKYLMFLTTGPELQYEYRHLGCAR